MSRDPDRRRATLVTSCSVKTIKGTVGKWSLEERDTHAYTYTRHIQGLADLNLLSGAQTLRSHNLTAHRDGDRGEELSGKSAKEEKKRKREREFPKVLTPPSISLLCALVSHHWVLHNTKSGWNDTNTHLSGCCVKVLISSHTRSRVIGFANKSV